jgi:mRNA-degrading endonuclease YafQ of YafQ-DinJ toxin-antitoxin module
VRYEFKTSFDRRFKKLSTFRQKKVYQAIDAFMKHLDGNAPLPPGLGLKNWHADYWEIRVGIKDRILFEFTDQIVFLLVGSHDEIKNFMKGQ